MPATTQCLAPDVFLEVFGAIWCEPTTVLTDLLLVALLLGLAMRSRGAARAHFALMAAAFLLGAARHLLHHELQELVPAISRVQNCATALALGLLARLLVLGRSARTQGVFDRGYLVAAAAFVIGHLLLDSFLLTVMHTAVAQLLAAAVVLAQGRVRGYRWFLVSVGLGLVCAGLYGFQRGPHPWFNHNDLAHLVMLPAYGALWLQLRSLGWDRDATGPPPFAR